MAGAPDQPWSVSEEFARGRQGGRFPTVTRSELQLAGMSLASITNLPAPAVPDASHAPGALLDFFTSSASQQSNRTLPRERPPRDTVYRSCLCVDFAYTFATSPHTAQRRHRPDANYVYAHDTCTASRSRRLTGSVKTRLAAPCRGNCAATRHRLGIGERPAAAELRRVPQAALCVARVHSHGAARAGAAPRHRQQPPLRREHHGAADAHAA